MILFVASQKGGPGKSTIARAVAVSLRKNDWNVCLADMDKTQHSTFNWNMDREEAGIEPAIDVISCSNPKAALKAKAQCDALVIDGTPYATKVTLEICKSSTMVILPTGVTKDDLRPALELAQELVHEGIKRTHIYFVVIKVPDNGEKEALSAIDTIKDWGYNCSSSWIPFKTSYGKAMDSGRSIIETRFPSINEKADLVIQDIFDCAAKLNK